MSINHKVTVVGSGYVGLSLGVLLSQHNDVKILDIDKKRVDLINKKKSTVADNEIEYFLKHKSLLIEATSNKTNAYKNADFIVIATPTNYDESSNNFDTTSVDKVIEDALLHNEKALIVIKSTIPVGHTEFLQKKYCTDRIIFSPEFLREGKALHDNLYPSRIIIGSNLDKSKLFANLLIEASKKKSLDVIHMSCTEAEAVKLFANTFLAMRISFFNELDSFSISHKLNSKNIIDGVCMDDRIGNLYNNPSFGYGGYCLPKDTKQLLANYKQVPQTLIQAIVSSNDMRKSYISKQILKEKPKTVGIYRLIMKEGSDNFRSSAIHDIMKDIEAHNIELIIYEPIYHHEHYNNIPVEKSLKIFKEKADIILANRISEELHDSIDKVYSRDLFRRD